MFCQVPATEGEKQAEKETFWETMLAQSMLGGEFSLPEWNLKVRWMSESGTKGWIKKGFDSKWQRGG